MDLSALRSDDDDETYYYEDEEQYRVNAMSYRGRGRDRGRPDIHPSWRSWRLHPCTGIE